MGVQKWKNCQRTVPVAYARTETESGFYISQEEPFLGATTDSLIHCDYCGDGCLEIKCPFTVREKFIFELLGDDSFLLEENAITKLMLMTITITRSNASCL